MLKYFNLLLLCLLISTLAIGQNATLEHPTARDHIKILKDGVLLVKLNSAQNKIDALNKLGKTGWAKQVAREQAAENKKLIEAFTKHYTFSPVYFFYAENSEKIKLKRFDTIILNANLEPAFRNGYFPGKFLVAEYGLIGHNQSRVTAEGKRTSDATENSTIEGLVISDENLVQLSDPFPYFVRSFKSLGKDLRRSNDRMVEKLNEKLIAFYKMNADYTPPVKNVNSNLNEGKEQESVESNAPKKPGILVHILLGIGKAIIAIF